MVGKIEDADRQEGDAFRRKTIFSCSDRGDSAHIGVIASQIKVV
jgi:hypothetical protein